MNKIENSKLISEFEMLERKKKKNNKDKVAQIMTLAQLL